MKYLITIAIIITAMYAIAEDKFGIFHPDQSTQRLILRGPDATIIIDANPTTGNPGISITSRKTGQVATLYVSPDGRAVAGIRDPKVPNAPAVLFSGNGNGYLQLRQHGGAHVLTPGEITK